MTILDPEVLEQARQFSERVSSSLSDAERTKLINFARPIAKALVTECGADLPALRVAGTMSVVMAGFLKLPLCDVADAITDTSAGYALAVGIIAGVIDAGEAPRCAECGHDLTADNDHADWCSGRFQTGNDSTSTPPGQYL